MILFRDGVEIARHEGAMAKPQLQAFLTSRKGFISPILYVAAIISAFFLPVLAIGIMVVSAGLWSMRMRTSWACAHFLYSLQKAEYM